MSKLKNKEPVNEQPTESEQMPISTGDSARPEFKVDRTTAKPKRVGGVCKQENVVKGNAAAYLAQRLRDCFSIDEIVEVYRELRHSKDDKVKQRALEDLLDRSYGKLPTTVAVGVFTPEHVVIDPEREEQCLQFLLEGLPKAMSVQTNLPIFDDEEEPVIEATIVEKSVS